MKQDGLITALENAEKESERIRTIVTIAKEVLKITETSTIREVIVKHSERWKLTLSDRILFTEVLNMFKKNKIRDLTPYLIAVEEDKMYSGDGKIEKINVESNVGFTMEMNLLTRLPKEHTRIVMKRIVNTIT